MKYDDDGSVIEDEDDFDFDDDARTCPICGGLLIVGYEEGEFWGTPYRDKVWYCPECEE